MSSGTPHQYRSDGHGDSRASLALSSEGDPGRTETSASSNHGDDKEIACKACGFEASFVPEGMLICEKCEEVHYCSTHCKEWDWKSGGHQQVCKGDNNDLPPSAVLPSEKKESKHDSTNSLEESFTLLEDGEDTQSSLNVDGIFEKPTRMALMLAAARRTGPSHEQKQEQVKDFRKENPGMATAPEQQQHAAEQTLDVARWSGVCHARTRGQTGYISGSSRVAR